MCKRPLCKRCPVSKLLCIKISLCKRFCVYELLCLKASVSKGFCGGKSCPSFMQGWPGQTYRALPGLSGSSHHRPWAKTGHRICDNCFGDWRAPPGRQVERAQENFAKACTQQCTNEFGRASLVVELAWRTTCGGERLVPWSPNAAANDNPKVL